MAFSYDPTTDVGFIRLLLTDKTESDAVYSDEEYTAFIAREGGSVRRAAALALETLASDEAYVQKAMRILDLQTNGPAEAKALMDRAAELRKQAEVDDLADPNGAFDIAPWVLDEFSRREQLIDQAVRTYG